jgi:TonB family protein
LGDLLLDNSTLAKKFGQEQTKPAAQQSTPNRASDISTYQAFSRPPGSGASFLGTGGVSDHLPNLPDGDITLLNEKASTYAGFVRRVAIQVFSSLRAQGWEQLSRYEIKQMTGFSTVEAVMSPRGQLLAVRLLDPSGSQAFDRVLNQAVSKGTRDPNPPMGAKAADGNIHFIFKARSWAESGSDPRSGAPFERRWLLLATGLE